MSGAAPLWALHALRVCERVTICHQYSPHPHRIGGAYVDSLGAGAGGDAVPMVASGDDAILSALYDM